MNIPETMETAAIFHTIDDFNVRGKRVLLRVDLNVPIRDGKVTDTLRIARVLPTIRTLTERGAKVVLLSHLGRPKGRAVPELSLRPIVAPLEAGLGRKVAFAEDCVGDVAAGTVAGLEAGQIALLENLRFHPGEEANAADFAGQLAALGELYVNDAFSCSHRAHASVERLAKEMPAAAGPLLEEELTTLERLLTRPKRPIMAIVGGAKVSTKLDVLDHLVGKMDSLAIGGAMANTFLLAQELPIGRSLAEPDMVKTAAAILARAAANGCRILLPEDVVVAKELREGIATETVPVSAMPTDRMILDVGPQTVARLMENLRAAKTLVWNGPLGAFETPPFDRATVAAAKEAARLTQAGNLLSVGGGGDTIAALHRAGLDTAFSYISTAGGAFLDWLGGKTLPGITALAPPPGRQVTSRKKD
ncbi:MAG: phosphoglycerate kinase [Pseudomonadota bacterium]